MSLSKKRYGLPILFFIVGAYLSIRLISDVVASANTTDVFEVMAGNAASDITFLVVIAVPVLLLEYVFFAIPGAVIVLFLSKTLKSASYDMNIMNVGRRFGGMQIVRRSIAPALFALTTSAMVKTFIIDYLGITIQEGDAISRVTLSLMGALVMLTVSLLLFTPTWILEDVGVVTHLKAEKMLIRQSPDTQGVGRWFSRILSGYAVIAYPIAMFNNHFYDPFVAGTLEISLTGLVSAFLWVVFLPFLVMAFVMPVAILNEVSIKRSRNRIVSIARRLGARTVRKERIEAVRRPGPRLGPSVPRLGIDDEDDENIGALPRPMYDAESGIMTTAKKIKRSKTVSVTASKKAAKKPASKGTKKKTTKSSKKKSSKK